MDFIIPAIGFYHGASRRKAYRSVTSLHGWLNIVDLIGVILKTLQVSYGSGYSLVEHGLASHKPRGWQVEIVRHSGLGLVLLAGEYVVVITVWHR